MLSRVWLLLTPWTAASSIHGIFQARVLEWGGIAFSRAIIKKKEKKKTSIGEDRERRGPSCTVDGNVN